MDDTEIAELEEGILKIRDIAAGLGLDPFPVHFEVVPANIMHEMGAYGVPGRFSHWTFGRAYQQSRTMHDYGLTKVYEMVINSDPAYAFLLDTNSVLENMTVAAHVLGHVDMFKHNAYFAHTDRGTVNSMAAHASRIHDYEYEYGPLVVEKFLDNVLAVEWQIDPHAEFKQPEPDPKRRRTPEPETEYDDLFYLGPDKRLAPIKTKPKFPVEPQQDLLLFITQFGRDLEDWQRDVMSIVRTEALYFAPQARTKIINEGWAAFAHTRIMRQMDLSSTQYVQFSRMHASIVSHSPGRFNPYALGLGLLEDIEKRWNDPSDKERERDSHREKGQGTAKVFEVAHLENDVSLIRNYMTAKLCEEQELFNYRKDEHGNLVIVDRDWEKVRDSLVDMVTNHGRPTIMVEDGNYRNAGELLLRHVYEGHELDITFAEETLKSIFALWGRPVHIATRLKDKPVLMIFDGVQKRRDGEP